jgi:formate dehydrogenase major subunit/formate dehydrogenase alpha subunit
VINARKTVLELLLQNYVDAGYAAGDQAETEFMHWVQVYGAKLPENFTPKPRYGVNSDDNPFVWVDMNKCILCTRCVRACAEVQGRFVWGVGYRGNDARIIAGADTSMLEARCESCGACVAYCPTGALDNKMSVGAGMPDKLVTTTCTYCGVGCQFNLNIKDNRIIRVTSNPKAPVNGMHLCVKGRYGYDFVHHPDRLTRPQVRRYLLEGSSKPAKRQGERLWDWVEVDWETALNTAAQKISDTRDSYGSDSIGVLTSAKCLNEENYLMNKLARQVVGTNNIDHCARL